MKLTKLDIVRMANSIDVSPNPASFIMARHMVPFSAMEAIINLGFENFDLRNLLHVLSMCEQMQVPLRRDEKKLLNALHHDVRFRIISDLAPSKVKVQKPSQKCFVLLQGAIGQHHLDNFTLRQEMTKMVEYAMRMLVAAEAYAIEGTGHGIVALGCLQLKRR